MGLGETSVLSCETLTVFAKVPVTFRMRFVIIHLEVICV